MYVKAAESQPKVGNYCPKKTVHCEKEKNFYSSSPEPTKLLNICCSQFLGVLAFLLYCFLLNHKVNKNKSFQCYQMYLTGVHICSVLDYLQETFSMAPWQLETTRFLGSCETHGTVAFGKGFWNMFQYAHSWPLLLPSAVNSNICLGTSTVDQNLIKKEP